MAGLWWRKTRFLQMPLSLPCLKAAASPASFWRSFRLGRDEGIVVWSPSLQDFPSAEVGRQIVWLFGLKTWYNLLLTIFLLSELTDPGSFRLALHSALPQLPSVGCSRCACAFLLARCRALMRCSC